MWVRNQKQQIINIDQFKMVCIENGKLVARNGREFQILFKGEQEICELLYEKIAKGLVMKVSLIDFKMTVEPQHAS